MLLRVQAPADDRAAVSAVQRCRAVVDDAGAPSVALRRCRSMRPHTLALTTVATLSLSAAAPAAADWTAPQTLSSPHTFASVDRPSFTTSGAAVASWGWEDDLGTGATVGASMATRTLPDAGFAGQRSLPRGTVGGAHPYGASRLLVATQTGDESDASLHVRFGSTRDSRFGPPRRIARARGLRGAQLAVNARGDAVLGWWVDDGVARDRVYVSLRRRSGAFGPPVRLATGRLRSISVAIGANGDVLAAWDALGVVRTRVKSRTDRGFRRADELRSADAFSAALQTAVSPSGRAWVAWTAQRHNEGGDSGDVFVQAATRGAAARRFGRALLLQRAPSGAWPAPVSLSVSATGDAVLGWALWNRQPGFTDIHAARVSAAGAPIVSTLAQFASVGLRDSVVAAAADDGGATILWSRSTEPSTDAGQLLAAVRAPNADWGDPELVFEGNGPSGSVAYPAGGGAPLVVFADRLAEAPLRRVVRATLRR